MGCPIRKSMDQRIFAPTHGLSQLITSFIASVSQGIHLAPFLTFSWYHLNHKTQSLKLKAWWMMTPLILSAVLVVLTFYSFLLCQYVKDLFRRWKPKCEMWKNNSQFSIFNSQFPYVENFSDWLRLSVFSRYTWRITDSNRWPPACKAGALASWANPPYS